MPQRSLVAGLAALTAAVASLAAAPPASAGTYDHDLVRFSDARGVHNRIVDLADGDRFSAGSPDSHRVVVQRYSSAADGWSAPETVYREDDLFTHDIRPRARAGVVTVDVDWWDEEVLDDDYAPDHSAGVICVGLACTDGVRSADGVLSGIQLVPDGSFAVFGVRRDHYRTWDGGTTWDRLALTGKPDAGRFTVQLAGDGSFVGLQGRREGDSCLWTLYTSAPRTGDLQEQVTSEPTPSGGDRCYPYLEDSRDPDRVVFFVDALEGRLAFRRVGGTWEQEPLPPGHDEVEDTGGATTMAPVFDRPQDPQAVLYSDDTHRIWSQVHRPWSDAWTLPREVVTTPADTSCRRGEIVSLGQGRLQAYLDCFTGGEEDGLDPADPVDTTLVALSLNGGTVWTAGLVHEGGAATPLWVGEDFGYLVSGDPGALLTYDRDGETVTTTVPLPFPSPRTDPIAATSGGRILRVAPRATDDGCRGTLRSAGSPESTQWRRERRFDLPASPGTCPELRVQLRRYDHYRLMVRSADPAADWRVVLERRDGTWHVR